MIKNILIIPLAIIPVSINPKITTKTLIKRSIVVIRFNKFVNAFNVSAGILLKARFARTEMPTTNAETTTKIRNAFTSPLEIVTEFFALKMLEVFGIDIEDGESGYQPGVLLFNQLYENGLIDLN